MAEKRGVESGARGPLIAEPSRLEAFDLIGFPGGFSYGTTSRPRGILAMEAAREAVTGATAIAARRGCPMIGACNGFQVLVQVGLLPAGDGSGMAAGCAPAQTTALSHNAGGGSSTRGCV